MGLKKSALAFGSAVFLVASEEGSGVGVGVAATGVGLVVLRGVDLGTLARVVLRGIDLGLVALGLATVFLVVRLAGMLEEETVAFCERTARPSIDLFLSIVYNYSI